MSVTDTKGNLSERFPPSFDLIRLVRLGILRGLLVGSVPALLFLLVGITKQGSALQTLAVIPFGLFL